MNYYPLSGAGKWYKGNLHTHTTVSDGGHTPEEVISIFKANHYDFLAITDHRIFNYKTYGNDILIIPATEHDGDFKKFGWACHHMIALDDSNACGEHFKDGERLNSVLGEDAKTVGESMLKTLKSKNTNVIYCHPNWSRVEFSDYIDLDGYFAMEIYNTGCYYDGGTHNSVEQWDSLLRRGKKVWGVATDDCHTKMHDFCGGWVVVKADELTQSAITDALLNGRFYSSTGPEIYDFKIEDGICRIDCSPCRDIHFVKYNDPGYTVTDDYSEPITHAEYKIGDTSEISYIRAECVDFKGKSAWTQPIFFDK